MLSHATPDPFAHAADLLDPPPWEPIDRPPLEPHQLPPEGRWDLWLLEAGRGAGKTEACARYFAAYMRANPGHRGRIIAPTFGDAVEACVIGPSGLQSVDPEVRWLPSAPGGAKVVWPNGSEALVLGTPFPSDVNRLRAGGNRHIDWWEEMAANAQLGDGWDQAQLGLRLGPWPHAIASTTPRNRKRYRDIRLAAGTVRTHGSIDDNPHLSEEWREKQKARLAGTRLGRQELGGELLEDIEGALWHSDWIEDHRVPATPDIPLQKTVVALDPSDGTADSDEQAIVAASKAYDHRFYVTHSEGHRETPLAWLKRAVNLARSLNAMIVVEKNHGGAFLVGMLEQAMREVGVTVPYQVVDASQGKLTRAEPVAILYEQGKVSHVGDHPTLEEQLTTYTGGRDSPDRLDALVWAMTELMGYGKPVAEDFAQAVPYSDQPVAGGAVAWS